MAAVGRVLLILGFVTAIYGVAASVYGGRTRDAAWIDSGRRAMYSVALMAIVAFVILDAAFIGSDFSYNIVAQGSSTTTPFLYRAAAIWATQQGSLLLWVMLLACWSSLALALTRRKVREVVPWAQATLFTFVGFFMGLNVFFANPFHTSSPAPAEGAGLDPLLRHTTMMVHPPMLYSGYTLLLVPFAFAIGALVSNRVNAEWIQVTRRFALAAWLCLGIGILLGARWSYTELGWGGFWAWDPVENAALMPWLVATAYIHSIMIQEKRGMLKVWNASLILLAGTMAIIGDFLVRSGILSSIHAFVSDPTLNIAFVSIICVMAATSIGLVVWRRESLRTEARLDSLFSREAMFMAQNMVLVALALVVFWVTFFPLISQALTGTEVAVGPPAFQPFVDPLAIAVVALAGIGPIIPWRRVTLSKLRRGFAFPVAAGLATLIVLLALVPAVTVHGLALALLCVGTFLIATVVQEYVRGVRARATMVGETPPVALGRLVRRNRRRYGGYIVHLGIAVALIGVAASTSFQHQVQPTLRPGQGVTVDGKRFTYVRPFASATSQKVSFGSVVRVTRGGRYLTTLRTSAGFYPSQDAAAPIGRFFSTNDGATTESQVGLDAGLTRDLWVAMQPNIGPLSNAISQGDVHFRRAINDTARVPAAKQPAYLNAVFALRDRLISELTQRWVTHPWPAQFKVIVSPLVTWLWLGAIIAACGGLIALWPMSPARRPRRGGPGGGPGSSTRRGRAGASAGPEVARDQELVLRLEGGRSWPAT